MATGSVFYGKKRFKAKQIVMMLREAEIQLAKGLNIEKVFRNLGIAPQSDYWCKEYSGIKNPTG